MSTVLRVRMPLDEARVPFQQTSSGGSCATLAWAGRAETRLKHAQDSAFHPRATVDSKHSAPEASYHCGQTPEKRGRCDPRVVSLKRICNNDPPLTGCMSCRLGDLTNDDECQKPRPLDLEPT
jgi:hypothetical protein